MEIRAVLIALATLSGGILSSAPAEAADACALSGGVLKGGLCFLPCDNPGEVRVQEPNGQLACVPPGQAAGATPAPAAVPPAPPDKPAAAAKPDQPAAPVKPGEDECIAKGGVRLGVACFLPCPNPGETRVQLANGALQCVVIAPAPGQLGTKAKDQKFPLAKKKR